MGRCRNHQIKDSRLIPPQIKTFFQFGVLATEVTWLARRYRRVAMKNALSRCDKSSSQTLAIRGLVRHPELFSISHKINRAVVVNVQEGQLPPGLFEYDEQGVHKVQDLSKPVTERERQR